MSKVLDRHQCRESEKPTMRNGIRFNKKDFGMILAILAFSSYVRLWNLPWPSAVVFDESNVGRFYIDYLKHSFSIDIHPPLGKLLLVLGSWSTRFDGQFDFEQIGSLYVTSFGSTGVPYARLRTICAIMGALAIPMAYLTLRSAGYTRAASVTAALMICYENGNIAISRFISLDSMLLCFTAFTTMTWLRFEKLQSSPFTASWWSNLIMAGLGLGLTISTKWVGLFTVGFISLRALSQIWALIGNRQTFISSIVKHIICRSIALLFIPAVIYLSMFCLHITLMTVHTDQSRNLMSRPFQHSLIGGEHNGTAALVTNNTLVRIRHFATNGGFLHSHIHSYPTGSKQQQVTLNGNQDEYNMWYISKLQDSSNHTNLIHNGDIVRFQHLRTGHWLHSHNHRPPMSNGDHYNEASAYVAENDWYNHWKVEIVDHDKSDPSSKMTLKALRSKLRLVHVGTRCSLMSKDMKLPDWGFFQQEVSCVKGKSKNTVWYIENSWPELDDEESKDIINYPSMSIFEKIREIHTAMWRAFNEVESHPYESKPFFWLMPSRGIALYKSVDSQFYVLGNPVIFYGTTLAILATITGYAVRLVFEKRKAHFALAILPSHVDQTIAFFFYGWACHFFPYILISQPLFLSYYFPSLYFGVLLATSLLETGVFSLNIRKRLLAVMLVNAMVYQAYRTFAPITYGIPWNREACEASKWQPTWDYDCNIYKYTNGMPPSDHSDLISIIRDTAVNYIFRW
ncbi:glycosyltransferase family 39 protein [Umbelopsis sp. PMI_123]|nr:glycosyltransferase family 39 protein [Umbelopsis sp. PMI_123]